MSDLAKALGRVEAAVDRLEAAVQSGLPGDLVPDVTPDVPVLRAERDRLEGEVEALRARAEEDAQLRQEAAEAVREALRDLRGAVGQGEPANA